MFTSGCELVTGLTNIIISLVSLYSFVKLRNKNNVNILWKLFFLCVFFDGIFGFIIHGINFNQNIVDNLWIILSLMFCITINILLTIFLNEIRIKSKKFNILSTFILTFLVYLIIFIETIIGIDFLLTFIIYAALCLFVIVCIIVYKYIKSKNNAHKYFILGILFQIIGGIILITFKSNLFYFDKNGIYHMFMILNIIMFYLGVNK